MSPNVLAMLFRTHSDSWFWIIIFFVLSLLFLKTGKTTLHKISQGLFRLISLIMIVSGIGQLIGLNFPVTYVIKGVLAIVMIGVAEMVIAKAKRGKRTGPFLAVFVILLALVLLLAYRVISI
ncbi:DUF1516 family protein [Aneurinibacillus sp. Ricciae_BoGa-3]|uniref:DUF1516 family protein n=1 Tax=Aneurinibacillus sp. Ricciae_BoGa-3 TaxID=3022697 RepID=UPI0023409788|nr:DUF1516 family protein [Aneurinibacillus sp. Ricciae_BoGa-3]WCK56589.1 DUF1516 family protein [Aneurinibacillus sp. Ricciae_BoGa-3]